MPYRVHGATDAGLNAHFDVDGSDVVFHARGGSQNSGGESNPDYGDGLRALLGRASDSAIVLRDVLVDSAPVRKALPVDERRILSGTEVELPVDEMIRLLSRRMVSVRPPTTTQPKGGNSTKRLRLRFATDLAGDDLARALGGRWVERSARAARRLPAEQLRRVQAHHVWAAVERALAGEVNDAFAESTDYDLVADSGVRFAPKMIFGMAASEALGQPIRPEHFIGGEDTVAFAVLRDAGFEVVPKGGQASRREVLPVSPEDREWVEGDTRVVQHVRKERSPSLSKAKKAAFIDEHGRLYCESCGMVPLYEYGPGVGDACIEVHHKRTTVAEMRAGHRTRLEDLECLCANCHRVVHARMRADQAVSPESV